MRLTQNFTLEELIKSDTANKYKIDNSPDENIIKNLKSLCENVLQPIRDRYGKPIIITSGYRCDKLNKKVGGVTTSQHLNGRSNFVIGIPSNLTAHKYIAIPCIAVFGAGAVPAKLANLTDGSASYNYVFFRGSSDSETSTPPVYNFARIEQIYPLPCKPCKIEVLSEGSALSVTLMVSLDYTADFSITATSATNPSNGKACWKIQMWGKITARLRSDAPSGTTATATLTLEVPNWDRNSGGISSSVVGAKPAYTFSGVTSSSPKTWNIPATNKLTFYLDKDSANVSDFGWYEYDANNVQPFHPAYIPYTLKMQSGSSSTGTFSFLD